MRLSVGFMGHFTVVINDGMTGEYASTFITINT
jgi:hypothetical protein